MVLRRAGRFVVFLIAVLAILAVTAGGGWLLWQQMQSNSGDSLDQGVSRDSLEAWLVGLYLNMHQDELSRPLGSDDTPIPFTIEAGETAGTIALRLQEIGLVGDAELFRLYVKYHGLDANLEAGEYTLQANMTMEEIAYELLEARYEEIEITILPGWRLEEIAEMLRDETEIPPEEFLTQARQGDLDSPALADRPLGASVEGYLFPDTYRIPASADARQLIEILLASFDARFTPEMRQAATAQGMTIYEVVTLSSIVEREAVLDWERPIIAGVYSNRLNPNTETRGYLQADPTFQYAKGYDHTTGKWWNAMGLDEAATVDSPYNTFLYPGLPPGPICSPSLASLQAAVYPTETDYLFFYSRGDGSHVFARTYEEHLQNQQQYQ
ncbi:MAG: endolytic transglycosylase MltG [Chloroflexota bacterium]|nr:endolytic transglycosylase MltG [Chloroflexota bacterium]